MPGQQEIVLQCAHCHAVTRYEDVYVHGQFRLAHKPDCKQQHEEFPKMYLSSRLRIPSN